MSTNYDDVLSQLRANGLIVDHLELGNVRRCKVEGSREKRGWYLLHPWRKDDGEELIVGSFGIWRGSSSNTQKIKLNGVVLTDTQKAAFKKQLAEDNRRAKAERNAKAYKAAKVAESAWLKCVTEGESDYLIRKGIDKSYGARFSPRGALVIPMTDHNHRIHGLQFILSKKTHARRIAKTERDKEYWPKDLQKQGHFHLIGKLDGDILLIAEGFATAASLHMATGLPVAVAFDANNLKPVADSFRKKYGYLRILICADDDRWTKNNAGAPWNPGVECASTAALSVNGDWIIPEFKDNDAREKLFTEQKIKNTDFNDLHQIDGLDAVGIQVRAKINQLGWHEKSTFASRYVLPEDGNTDKLRPIDSYEELLERFALIYGHEGSVFDFQERRILKLSDMRDACQSRELHRRWQESSLRKIVRPDEVGFDPTGLDASIKCNLWGGWPTEATAGNCEVLLDLLRYLTVNEDRSDPKETVFQWVLKWLAYPIQYPGTKMKTALIFHGPQGAGKNMFFEAYQSIYGKYGLVVDQEAVEDKYNSLFSAKLFLIGDEVVARQELYHTKNKLKGFVTGDTIRINPKNIAAHTERNHVNVVFLSNEAQPLVLDEDDRRYAVIWTPAKLPSNFYDDVKAEIDGGGVAALHHYLLNLSLDGFKPHTLPPMTQSKRDLIDLSMDSTERFWSTYTSEMIDGFKPLPIKSEDVFELYRIWCGRVGITKFAPMHVLTGKLGKRQDIKKSKCRYFAGAAERQAAFLFPKGQFDTPDGKTQSDWLSKCVTDFRDSMESYRNRGSLAS